MLSVLALALAPTFFVMLLGYCAGMTRHINNMRIAELNTVVMSYCLPASLFVATATSKWSELAAQWPILLSLTITMMGVFAVWYVYQRRVRRQNRSEAVLQALAVGQPNYAAAAFPVITALFGSTHLSTVAVGIAVGSLLPSPLTLALLELDKYRKGTTKLGGGSDPDGHGEGSTGLTTRVLKSALAKPIVVAPVMGMLVSLLGWRLPAFVDASLRQIGIAAGGMGLMVTGLVLSESKFRMTLNTTLGVGMSNVIQPLVTFIVCHSVKAPVEVTKLAVVMAALPSGFFGILFGNTYGRLSREANSTIIASTIFSAVTLAGTIRWTYSYGG
ncbi:AEC family transporter [Caballeronia sp. GAFFF1]|uniref:AEC family transporter n=1 Tax=Caballeronia sp. GAFFF1 TaxID=2921779 RepID=UPI00202978AC|nr:AEC family transporter [Caballeronia sp. GAFFF1]